MSYEAVIASFLGDVQIQSHTTEEKRKGGGGGGGLGFCMKSLIKEGGSCTNVLLILHFCWGKLQLCLKQFK